MLDVSRLEGAKVEYVRAALDRLPSSIRLRFLESSTAREIVYTASERAGSLALDTNSGDRWNLNASVASPLPTSVRFCASRDAFCTGYARPARAGAFAFDASEHATVSVFDCIRPLGPACTRTGSPTEFTQVDLRLRHLDADADFSDLGASGHLFMNTATGGTRHTMNGSLLSLTGSGGGFSATFPPGFWAEDRLTEWQLFGLIKTKSGAVNCPPGTSLAVRVLGFWLDVTSFLC